jgi:hypothetical protein
MYIFVRLSNRESPLPQEISEKQHRLFLEQCFSLSPADRPSADQILAFVREELSYCLARTPRTAEARAVRLLNICSFFKLISLPGRFSLWHT